MRGRVPKVRAAAWAALLCVACADEPAGRVLRLGHGQDPSHPLHRAVAQMAEHVVLVSAGTLRIEVHPGAELGDGREHLERLRSGRLAMASVSAAVLAEAVPEYRALSVPYLFRDAAHRSAVQDGDIGRALLAAGEPRGLRGLAFYEAGARSFYTRDRPVTRPADLEGLRIGTGESPSSVDLVEALGAVATPIAPGDLFEALQQGVVDGGEGSLVSFHRSRHFEVARFYSLDEHTAPPDVLLVGTQAWERLTERERRWLEDAAESSVHYQRQLWREATAASLAAAERADVTVLRTARARFARAARRVREALEADGTLRDWIRRIDATEPRRAPSPPREAPGRPG